MKKNSIQLNWLQIIASALPHALTRVGKLVKIEVNMHIIWKRPDGFQNALPEDFRRIELSNGAHLWVHRHELDWYPFQVSGDWLGQQQTTRLNRLVNLLESSDAAWRNFLEHYYDDELKEPDLKTTAEHLKKWLDELKSSAKGETWEVHIIQCALADIHKRLSDILAG